MRRGHQLQRRRTPPPPLSLRLRPTRGRRDQKKGARRVACVPSRALEARSEERAAPAVLDAHGVLAGLRGLPTDLVEHRRAIDRAARYEAPQRGEVLQGLAMSLRPLRLSRRGPDELDRRLVTR